MDKAARLQSVLQKRSRRIIGLMSGMSMDGVDLALADISGEFPNLQIRLEDSFFLPYSTQLKADLLEARSGGSTALISELNFRVGGEFANCVQTFLKEKKISSDSIDAIGSHGQTLFHRVGDGYSHPSTLQIGSGSLIAERTGILTVFNFREKDLAVGGTGAPLVPLVDYLLFREDHKVKALNNLGSISNLTLVAPHLDEVMAFDTGPANMPIDFYAAFIPGNPEGIDLDGRFSQQGKVVDALLNEFLKNPFFAKSPPKAAGYAEFGPVYLERLRVQFQNEDPMNLLRTAVEFSARTLADAYKNFIIPRFPQLSEIILTGGGAKNPTLVQRIRDLLPGISVQSLDDHDRRFSDAKEALAFAVLANETLSGRAGNVPQVTGASRAVVLGEIAL